MYRRDNAIYKDVLCFLLSYQTSISGNSIANITLQAVTCQVIFVLIVGLNIIWNVNVIPTASVCLPPLTVKKPFCEAGRWIPGVLFWVLGRAELAPSGGRCNAVHVHSSGCCKDLGWVSCSSGSAPLVEPHLRTADLSLLPSQELHIKIW